MFKPRLALLTRMKDLDGNTLCFTTSRVGRARSHADFIEKDQVPEFIGDSAWFEIVKRRVPNSPWPQWTVVRRLMDKPR